MKGWKTWTGAALVAGSAVARYFGQVEIAELLLGVGAAVSTIGIAHKVEKTRKER